MPIPITNTPGSLGPSTCYANEQARYNAYIAALQSSFPGGFTGILMQQTAPGPDQRDQFWVVVNGSNQITDIRTFANGAWTSVVPAFFPLIPGTVCDFFGASGSIAAPWYICNGQTITGTYSGNLVTPNLQGLVTLGTGTNPSTGTTFNNQATGGEETHVLTLSELPAHDHPVGGGSAFVVVSSGSAAALKAGSDLPVQYPGLTGAIGSNLGHNNIQPYMALYKMIYWP